MVRFGAAWMKEKAEKAREENEARRERYREEGRADILRRMSEVERERIEKELSNERQSEK